MFSKAHLLIAISLLLTATQPSLAQGMEAGVMQSINPTGALLGPEQDSLLPPEVVPLDPNSASTLSNNQAQARQFDMQGSMDTAPGLLASPQPMPVAPAANTGNMRQQAFNQLYGGQSSLPPDANQQIWRSGQATPEMTNGMPGMQGGPGSMAGAMPPGMAPSPMPGGPNYQMANNPQQQGYVAQSQTLTAQSKNQPSQTNTRRGGISNMINYASAFGAGALTSSFFTNPGNAWLGAGMFGMTMTGLGVRNNSRF